MATTTVNIPLTTLPVGVRDFGPAPIADTDTSATFTIDRTVAAGLKSVSPTVNVNLTVYQSDDGGVTWFELGGGDFPGGDLGTAKFANTAQVQCWFQPGTGRQARAHVIVTGGSVAVQGSLTIQ
jgi:hypothetical protein